MPMICQIKSALSKYTFIIKFIKFGIVGGTVFVVHTSMLWFLLRILQLDNIVAISGAYAIAVLCHFSLNNFFTFSDSDAQYKRRIAGYVIFVLTNYVLSTAIISTVLAYVADNVLFATVASTSVMMFFNFFVLNKFVFTRRDARHEHTK